MTKVKPRETTTPVLVVLVVAHNNIIRGRGRGMMMIGLSRYGRVVWIGSRYSPTRFLSSFKGFFSYLIFCILHPNVEGWRGGGVAG